VFVLDLLNAGGSQLAELGYELLPGDETVTRL